MPKRAQPIDNPTAGFQHVLERLDRIDDSLRDRLLPPGYVVRLGPGDDLTISSPSGTTATLVFT